MKKFYSGLLLYIILSVNNSLCAQSEIWGLHAGGGDGFGVLYGMSTGSTGTSTQYTFSGAPGANPQFSKLLQASNGKLYGMTNLGGLYGMGVIFEYDTLTSAYTRKLDFNGTNGANPKGALIQAADGKLYGMTQLGGASNFGVIFSYDLSSSTYSVLASFTGTTGLVQGSLPAGSLIQPDPTLTKLYGVARLGGSNNVGVLFEYDYGTGAYTTKVNFSTSTLGSFPVGQLVKATSASSSTTTLYGLASAGGTGTGSPGTLFEYDYVANTMTKRVDFATTTGSSPQGSLLLCSNGRLYGTTLSGGLNSNGVIFEYIISTNTFNKLTDLQTGSGNMGGNPSGDLMEASNGKLYGLTRSGGTNNLGALFEYDVSTPSAPVYTKKYDFASSTGSTPWGTLMQVNTGKVYGVTSTGGAASTSGVLFQYNISSATYTKKIDLNFTSGGYPNGALVQASNGKLYGLASVGGSSNQGVIFEYDRTSSTYTKKIDLTGNTGTNPGGTPYGYMTLATNGKLYGMTSTGGISGLGVLFDYDATTNTYTKRIDFNGSASTALGGAPYGGLTQFTGTGTATGKLYGMTKQGGSSNQGVIFEFDPSTNTFTKKVDLSLASANGYSAFGAMVESNNKLYGMTQLGGASNLGVIFEYDPNTGTYTKKIDFTGTSGAAMGSLPFGSLVQTNTVGILYGMTKAGGANDLGVIFEYNVSTNTYTKKYDMTSTNGSQPLGSMIRAANGKLYGVTNTGGANGSGVLFEYDVDNVIYTKKMDLSNSTGNYPGYTQLTEICTKPLTPGSIVSSTNQFCQSDPAVKNYSISAVSNATAYAWSLPAGASITSGGTASNMSANLSGVAAGTYTYGVAGINVCGSGTLSVSNLTVNALPSVSVNSGAVCAGSVFTITGSGATSYSVQGGSFTVQPSSNASYTIIGISSLGCVSANTATSNVTVNALPTIGVNSGTICQGSAFTMIPTGVNSSTVSGGSLVVSPSTNTFYTLTGTDLNGCISANTATAFVTVNALPSISINNGTMCAGTNVTLSPSGAGTGGTYTVGSLTGAGPFIVSPSSNTTYVAVGASSFGCLSSNTATASVTVYTLPVISVNNPNMCLGQSTLVTPSGAATYTMGTVNGSGPFSVAPSSSTSYTISGTSSFGCVSASSATAAVTVYSLPVIGVNSGSICAGDVYTFIPTGALTYTMSGPVVGTSFTVSPPLSASYTIAGTNSNGCVSAGPATANVTVFALPTLSVNSGTTCAGTAFTIIPSGGSNYTLQPGTIVTSTSVTVTPSSNATYTLFGVNSLGCAAAVHPVSSVNVFSLPVISASNGAVCQGAVFTSTVSGASSYTYVTGSSTMTPTGSLTLTPVSTTTVNVTGTSAAGCISASPALMTITVNPLPSVSITGTNAICFGDATALTASGANTYNWGASTNTVLNVNPTSSTVYTVIGTDLNNCSNSATFSLTVNPLPIIIVPSGAVCTGNCYTLTPGGASTYTFSSGSAVVCPSSTSNYTVFGTSVDGCVSQQPAVATVSVVNILTVTISGNTSVCSGSSLTLTANGASSYFWNTGAPTNTISVSPTTATGYTVLGTSGTCSDVATTTITVNPLPIVLAVAQRTTICLSESVELVANGAINYVWSTSGTTNSIIVSPVVTTIYTVTGTDANNCSSTAVVTIAVDQCTGIKALSGGWQYSIYPNPNSGQFFIETSEQVHLTVVNALGQTVLSGQLQEGKNQVDLDQMAKGIYFVQLKNGTTNKLVKIVKQ